MPAFRGLDSDVYKRQLGELRVQKTYQMLNKTDIAILVVNGTIGMTEEDLALLEQIQKKQIPYVIAFNKCDLCPASESPVSYTHLDVYKRQSKYTLK